MRLYYVANARMPNEKAHGIQIAKMCEAFAEEGAQLTLVVPARASRQSLQEFYGLRMPIRVVRLWVPDFYLRGRSGFFVSSACFMLASLAYLWVRRLVGERFVIYTVDMDTFSGTLLPLAGPCVTEMHTPKPQTRVMRFFIRQVRGIVATNSIIKDALKNTFAVAPEKLIVEPNGVDEPAPLNAEEARQKLGLPAGPVALYVGRFYKWKGLEVLAPASRLLAAKGVMTLVLGGTKDEFERIFGDSAQMHFAQAKPADVRQWMQASDVLLALGTAKNQESNRYTSPMKIFEYLATGRPVVASATEALKDLVPGDIAYYCAPDDPSALAEAVMHALENPAEDAAQKRIELARAHTWRARSRRILAFLAAVTHNTYHG